MTEKWFGEVASRGVIRYRENGVDFHSTERWNSFDKYSASLQKWDSNQIVNVRGEGKSGLSMKASLTLVGSFDQWRKIEVDFTHLLFTWLILTLSFHLHLINEWLISLKLARTLVIMTSVIDTKLNKFYSRIMTNRWKSSTRACTKFNQIENNIGKLLCPCGPAANWHHDGKLVYTCEI